METEPIIGVKSTVGRFCRSLDPTVGSVCGSAPCFHWLLMCKELEGYQCTTNNRAKARGFRWVIIENLKNSIRNQGSRNLLCEKRTPSVLSKTIQNWTHQCPLEAPIQKHDFYDSSTIINGFYLSLLFTKLKLSHARINQSINCQPSINQLFMQTN